MNGSDIWGPGISMDILKVRALLLSAIREFFRQKGVMEVVVPTLGASTTTDLHINSFSLDSDREVGKRSYLQTSPEFFMKRLLASGSGPVFYLGSAFRAAESGLMHNPEFTLLEWYQPGYTLSRLMKEVKQLVHELIRVNGKHMDALFTDRKGIDYTAFQTISYRKLFEDTLGFNPHVISSEELLAFFAQRHSENLSHITTPIERRTRENCLDYLFSTSIQPELIRPVFVTGFPASQAALSKKGNVDGDEVALRFELYWNGIELANGYDELDDADELEARMATDNQDRMNLHLPLIEPDQNLLAAMRAGLPECSGVALGFDRLVALLTGEHNLSKVMAFRLL